MPAEGTRQRFLSHTLGLIGGTMVIGNLVSLLAVTAQRKEVLRVAIERDFETAGVRRGSLRAPRAVGAAPCLPQRREGCTPLLGTHSLECMAGQAITRV